MKCGGIPSRLKDDSVARAHNFLLVMIGCALIEVRWQLRPLLT